MRIQTVQIKNFRCLEDVEIDFDDVTSFIGPNGAGKSTVLRALDWFFNGERGTSLAEEDVFVGATADNRTISVRVTFKGLTARDREALTDLYAPAGVSTFTATRTWKDGEDKTSGTGRTFPEFGEIRALSGKPDRRRKYAQLQEAHPELDLPNCKTADEVDTAMRVWESNHLSQLVESDLSSNHFFGFNGQSVLSGIFDFVFVTADLRASEESVEGRKTVLGRILEKSLNREAANRAFSDLTREIGERQAAINREYLGSQLVDLGDALTKEVEVFTSGRQVRLLSKTPELKPSAPVIRLAIGDSLAETSIERQGHGFQRAVLIAALKLLAERREGARDGSVISLAIEEPELFQHPTQARVFANVLRTLAEEESAGIQVSYATHSPTFISAPHFDQVRRVTREAQMADGHPTVSIRRASMVDVTGDVSPHVPLKSLLARWNQVCTVDLAEAIFADAVVLVEGDTDKAILEGAASRKGQIPFERLGISVAVANGKDGFLVPHAILSRLGIATLVVFDNDIGSAERTRTKSYVPDKLPDERQSMANAEHAKHVNAHRKLLQYFGLPVTDYPVGAVSPGLFAWADTLEEVLTEEWDAWELTRSAIVAEQRGAAKKNAATYALAARECGSDPSGSVSQVLDLARALVA